MLRWLTRHGERVTYTWWVAGGPTLGGTEQIYGFDVEASKYWHLPWDIILLVNAEVAGVDYSPGDTNAQRCPRRAAATSRWPS